MGRCAGAIQWQGTLLSSGAIIFLERSNYFVLTLGVITVYKTNQAACTSSYTLEVKRAMRDEFIDDDDVLFDDEGPEEEATATSKVSKAWRSIERLREMRELRKNLDDFLLEDITDPELRDLHL
jgi:hypothetical protein